MSKIQITNSDILSRTLISEPGWYPADLAKVEVAKSKKNDGSNVTQLHFVVAKDPYTGVPVTGYLSEKVPAFWIAPLKAFNNGADLEPGAMYDMANNVGKRIEIFIAPGDYDGKTTNQIKGYRPLQEA